MFTLNAMQIRGLMIVAVLIASPAFAARPKLTAQPNLSAESSLTARYEHQDTRDLVTLVHDAVSFVKANGEAAFAEFARPDSRWRHRSLYIFVLAPDGTMLVHPDPTLEGENELELKDISGRPITRGLIDAVTADPEKTEGWHHYLWPTPGGLLPRWKSTYVQAVTVASGKRYIIGSGVYNDRMERSFVVDAVDDAAREIERHGKAAFAQFHDPTGRFMVKDAYIFVLDPDGIDLVNPAFPNLEGRSLLDAKDTQGHEPIREMLKVVRTANSGWVDYMWPRPGESVSTKKSAYVRKVRVGDTWLLVGCGVYLADAPKTPRNLGQMTAPMLMSLVREGAALLEKHGEDVYADFRKKHSEWLRDDTYFFVWALDGTRVLHTADPTLEGRNGSDAKDVLGRPYGKMFLDAAASPSGEGWVHYQYPEPGGLFPAWKSVFVKRVTFPSGKAYLVGSGIYHMQMDKTLLEDVVNRAADLVAKHGPAAFATLRDPTGPYRFMDTYVFVDTPDGFERVNPAQPSLEGKNVLEMKDVNGSAAAREYIDAAMKNGAAWTEYWWYKPGDNTPERKQAYVKKVQVGEQIFVVGSGLYVE